jgi:5-formyltetrahydrofolate cyclo-ligase
LFLERELDPSIACNPGAESKKALRRMLLEARLHAASEPAHNAALNRRILDTLKHYGVQSVGFYWPLSGEFDARTAMAIWLAADAQREASLPVVKERGLPLEFHAWAPDTPMKIGHHKIAEPTSGRVVVPDRRRRLPARLRWRLLRPHAGRLAGVAEAGHGRHRL